jgi:hypothetical protein
MITKHLLLGVIVILVLAGCAPLGAPGPIETSVPTPGASPQTVSDFYITYHRSGGLIGSNDTWTITLQGKLSQQGSGASSQLTAAQMDELAAAIRDARFMELQNSFQDKNTCCDRYEYTITVTTNGQSKTVRTVDGSPIAPPTLMHLIDILNQLVAAPTSEAQ